MFDYTQKQMTLLSSYLWCVYIYLLWTHDALKGMQIRRRLNSFYNPNTERELYLSVLPKPTIIEWE